MSKIILLLLFLICNCLDAAIIRRAAFDFGSGKIKMQVADVDTDTKKLTSIYSETRDVPLYESVSQNESGLLSEEIQKEAIFKTGELLQKARDLGVTQLSGLATEVYRKVPNGQTLVDRYFFELGIPVKIISQEEEGKYGFLAMVAENQLDPQKTISWDIGGGSFQITYLDDEDHFQVYMAPFGRLSTKVAIIKNIKEKDPLHVTTPNPMNRNEWETSLLYFANVLPQVPETLATKLQNENVQLIGMSAHPDALRSLKKYTIQDVHQLVEERLGKSDEELKDLHPVPPFAVSELALIHATMTKLNRFNVKYIRTNCGFTSALLLEEKNWE